MIDSSTANLGRILRQALGVLKSPRTAYAVTEPFFVLTGRRARNNLPSLADTEHVLVVKLDEIGDVVLATALLRELRWNLDSAWITLVVKPSVLNLVETCPYVNDVIAYDQKHESLIDHIRSYVQAWRLAAFHLWRYRYDLAIVPRWDTDAADATLLAYLSGASRRMWYSEEVSERKKRRNRGYDRVMTDALGDQNDGVAHEVTRNLNLVRALGGTVHSEQLELWLTDEDERFIDHYLKSNHATEMKNLIALVPGAGAAKRRWPLQRYVNLGQWLLRTFEATILLLGGPGEEPLSRVMERQLVGNVVNTVGEVSLRQTAALLGRCQLFVGNDSGPMHIAAAMRVPIVEISCHPSSGASSSNNSPERFGPWSVPSAVLQPDTPTPPCVDECVANAPHCILNISTTQVQEAVKRQWVSM